MKSIKLDHIRIDGGTQPRAALNESVVAEYAEALHAGAKLPPVVVFFDGAAHWLADGFHRFHAHRKANLDSIAVETRTGTNRDAVLYSVGANDDHGLRRSVEDKRGAVRKLLDDAEWAAWSDREIAKACRVTHPFVASLRRPVTGNVSSESRTRTYTTKHGTEAKMRVGPIAAATNARAKPAQEMDPAPTTPAVLAPVLVTPAPAPAKPAKGAPTIESLQAENATLREELEAARENARELADTLESYMACEEGIEAAAKALAKEKGIRRTIETQRDQWMTKANEAIRTIKARDRQIAALTRKVAA